MVEVAVCGDTGCRAWGADEVIARFEAERARTDLERRFVVKRVGCPGFCERGPLVSIRPQGIFYQRVTPDDVPEVVSETIGKYNILGRLLYSQADSDKRFVYEAEVPFYAKQRRNVLALNGAIDPTSIEDAIAFGGYAALEEIFSWDPGRVCDVIERSGLRGRGGGGFPTGTKWRFARGSKGDRKFIICNADEGDPGAFMDRAILEGNPHAVIEGMIVGAYTIGAGEAYIYCRAEYPLAVERLGIAIRQAEELGLLGENILGSGFNLRIRLYQGAGAFVCGEETALIKSIEGACGEPNQRPPYPAVAGLWGKPTVINNVETLATVPVIMAQGARWFSAIGTQKSKGTKVFSLVGKVKHIGLVEVPMGTTLREIIYGIGGGVPKGRTCKAVQTGGPSGGCIPEKLFNLPVDYEALAKAGSIMGSGGLIVMDDRTCMVDVARYFMTFLEHESCGKCTPCRVGVRRMRELLDAICSGTAAIEDLEVLEHMATMVSRASLCGLGRTAPNPVLSGLRHFKDEFLAHIRDKKCPAGVCKPLVTFVIDPQACIGCGACIKACPAGAVTGSKKKPHSINHLQCIKCGACEEICPAGAVAVE